MFKDKYSSSPLELAIDKKDIKLVDKLMDFCINQDKYGLLYSDLFIHNLQGLKSLGIDLKPLFASNILFHKIDFGDNHNDSFKEIRSDLKYCIVKSNQK